MHLGALRCKMEIGRKSGGRMILDGGINLFLTTVYFGRHETVRRPLEKVQSLANG